MIVVARDFVCIARKLWIIIRSACDWRSTWRAYSYFLLNTAVHFNRKNLCTDKRNNTDIVDDLQIGTQLTQDYKTIITGRSVMEEVVDKLHWDMDYKNLVKKIEVENPKIHVF